MAQVVELRGGYYSDFRFRGTRYKRFLSKDKREALTELGKLIERVRGERRRDKADLPWTTFKERLLHGQRPHKRANTQKRDIAAFAILETEFHPDYLSDVTPKMLRDLVTIRLRAGLKPATVKREISSIKAKMRWAEEQGHRLAEDWRSVKLPKVPRKRPHYHKREDMIKLLGVCAAGPRTRRRQAGAATVWEKICWLGSRAGLRRAEMYWLEKTDIDFAADLIKIRGKDGWLPKDSDERDILLLPDLKDFLTRELPMIKGRWVLDNHKGQRFTLDVLSARFTRYTKMAGLKGNIQTLRHTYLTHLANDGVNIYALKDWAGHSDVRTTMGYIHPAESYRAELPKIKPLRS